MSSIAEHFQSIALQKNFPITGCVDIDLACADPAYALHIQAYESYLASRWHAEMQYLERSVAIRKNPRLLLASAQSVFCVFVPYRAQKIGTNAEPHFARYAAGKDYHEDIQHRLEEVLHMLQNVWHEKLAWKVCVDATPLLERMWAHLCGCGFIGKNGMLIHPLLGSYGYLAVILMSQLTGRAPQPMKSRCGYCQACMQGCPTQALNTPYRLEPSKCIAYHTLENKKTIPESISSAMGNWVAGCDICQEVCPFNRKSMQAHALLEPQSLALPKDWASLIAITNQAFKSAVQHSALNRMKPAQWNRNLITAFLNAIKHAALVEQPAWSSIRYAIEHRLQQEEDPIAHAAWQEVYHRLYQTVKE